MSNETTTTKRVIYNGVEIRRSNEMTNSDACLRRNPLMWVVDGIGCARYPFKTQKAAQQFIDDVIRQEANSAHGDWSGNYFVVRVVDGKFTEVAISHDEYKTIKRAGTEQ